MNCTVCIPTLNASSTCRDLLARLKGQTLQSFQILVLDSSSTDGTVEYARKEGCRVISVPRQDFRHGGTRQLGADLADHSDVVVFLTQDSLLADSSAIERLVSAFADASVGAAYGRQLPRVSANPIEAHHRLFNYPSVSEMRSLGNVIELGFRAIFFSNSFGAYRTTALGQIGGFPKDLDFGEDTVAAARLLLKGWRIAYVADAQAYHSHAHSFADEFRRYCRVGRLHASESWLLSAFGGVSGEGRKFVSSELAYLVQRAPWLIPQAMLRDGLKYLAYKIGRCRLKGSK